MSMIPEDKVVWGRDGSKSGRTAAIILFIIIGLSFLALFGYGFNEGLTRDRPTVTLLTPTTGG